MTAPYLGRFAPSPTGPLHAGSLVAAVASWLDARAHGGRWWVRIEDVDTPRTVPGAASEILRQLAACGLHSDAPPEYQSQRSALYQHALDGLIARQQAFACGCSRKDIDNALSARGEPLQHLLHPTAQPVYPGTCRQGLHGQQAPAWRFKLQNNEQNKEFAAVSIDKFAIKNIVDDSAELPTHWTDRRLGPQQQDVATAVGDFVLQRADGCFSYQLAVVVDDAAQGITHVVRGQDLADNTARQIVLQRALGLPTPQYLHTPLVLAADGLKLSKQNQATPLQLHDPAQAVTQAVQFLGLDVPYCPLPVLLERALGQWRALYGQK